MSPRIHKTAVVDKTAKIAPSVEIGPYCVIGPHVELAEGVKLYAHVYVTGYTYIGADTDIFPFASIGCAPQDLKYKGEQSFLSIGRNNIIREYVTIHPGTALGGRKTVIGDNCLFMIGAHVAHDCIIGNNVVLANNATLGGHVRIGDYAILGGLSAVHQFVRIGCHAIIGGVSAVVKDVLPYANAVGKRANIAGVNITGLKRRKFDREDIKLIQEAFLAIFAIKSENFNARVKSLAASCPNNAKIIEIVNFLKEPSARGICMPRFVAEAPLKSLFSDTKEL